MLKNNATLVGTGQTISSGLATDGNGYVSYDIVAQASAFSVTLKFSASAVSTGILIGSSNLISGAAVDGFCIWVDSDGVRANYSDGATIPTRCEVDLGYADGTVHTVTYVVDGANHTLRVDALTEDANAATITGIGTTSAIVNNGDGTNNFIGTIYRPRVFDVALSAEEHVMYRDVTDIRAFMDQPYSVLRCDEICDDTDGHYIWDRTVNLRDAEKGDRADSDTFPEFETDKYGFDSIDDYIKLVTRPDDYTVTAALSTPEAPYPYISQANDTTLTADLEASGSHYGYLHSLIIHSAVLNAMQLLNDEYQHLYWLHRGRAFGFYHRAITEDTCQFAQFLDAGIAVFEDYSTHLSHGVSTGVTRDGVNGCTFSASGGVEFDHVAARQLARGTIAVLGNFDSSVAAGTILDKGVNYKLRTNGNQLDLNGSTISHTFADNEHIGVTFKDGFKPRFYVDGVYIGEGTSNFSESVGSTDVTVGNNNERTENTAYSLRQIYLGDEPLTDDEMAALYFQALAIGATPMQTGDRIDAKSTHTGTAISQTVDPGNNFELIDVSLEWDVAPTTSEELTIKSINSSDGTTEILEYRFDPSLSTRLSHSFTFQKKFANGRTIKVEYTNTDGNTIKLLVQYQTNPTVA